LRGGIRSKRGTYRPAPPRVTRDTPTSFRVHFDREVTNLGAETGIRLLTSAEFQTLHVSEADDNHNES